MLNRLKPFKEIVLYPGTIIIHMGAALCTDSFWATWVAVCAFFKKINPQNDDVMHQSIG